MMEGDLETRLEKEGRLQRRRIAWVVVALLALAVSFTAGMIAGVKLERGRKVAFSPQLAPPPPTEEEPSAQQEVPITFYERLTKEPAAEGEAPERAEAPPEATKPTLEKPPPQALYFIQVASFRRKANAESLVKRLKAKGLEAELVPVTIKGTKWFRVVVKGLDEEGLEEATKDLKGEGFEDLRVGREG